MSSYIDDFKYAINEVFLNFGRAKSSWHPVNKEDLKGTDKCLCIFNLLEINNLEKVDDKRYTADIKVYLEMETENAFNAALRLLAFFNLPNISKELKDNNIEVMQVSKIRNLLKTDDINKQDDNKNAKDEETRLVGLEIDFRLSYGI